MRGRDDDGGGRFAERAVGERSELPTEGGAVPAGVPDPELVERPRRRRFSAEYKLRVLAEIDDAPSATARGAVLRREGLYSSLITEWRRARDAGDLIGSGRPRGRPKNDPRDAKIVALERRAERAEAELAKARKVIEVQGNVSALLGELLEPKSANPSSGR